MPDPNDTEFKIVIERIALALEASAGSLECLCQHFGARKPADSKPANRSKRGGR